MEPKKVDLVQNDEGRRELELKIQKLEDLLVEKDIENAMLTNEKEQVLQNAFASSFQTDSDVKELKGKLEELLNAKEKEITTEMRIMQLEDAKDEENKNVDDVGMPFSDWEVSTTSSHSRFGKREDENLTIIEDVEGELINAKRNNQVLGKLIKIAGKNLEGISKLKPRMEELKCEKERAEEATLKTLRCMEEDRKNWGNQNESWAAEKEILLAKHFNEISQLKGRVKKLEQTKKESDALMMKMLKSMEKQRKKEARSRQIENAQKRHLEEISQLKARVKDMSDLQERRKLEALSAERRNVNEKDDLENINSNKVGPTTISLLDRFKRNFRNESKMQIEDTNSNQVTSTITRFFDHFKQKPEEKEKEMQIDKGNKDQSRKGGFFNFFNSKIEPEIEDQSKKGASVESKEKLIVQKKESFSKACKHELQCCIADDENYVCHVCGKDIHILSSIFRCRQCEYCECIECMDMKFSRGLSRGFCA